LDKKDQTKGDFMFGYLRFFLAFLVLISHVNIRFYGMNPGVIAVVIFYLLAGYVVSHLWADVIPEGPGRLYRFYRDRALRIWPLYGYVVLLTLVFLGVTRYGAPEFSFLKLLGNALIVPVNYYMMVDTTILKSPSWCLIPPAWSLGAELQAYLIFPLVLTNKRLKLLLTAASLMVYLLANFSVLHPDYFGYRLIFGVFFIFVTGSSIRQAGTSRSLDFDRIYPWALWLAVAVLGGGVASNMLVGQVYTRETLLGIFMGIPLVAFLGKFRKNLPGNRMLGGLSYGVFLSHFLVIWALDHTGLVRPDHPLVYIPVLTLGSVLLAFVGVYFLEKQVDRIRK
jgi:peptidoglycan/LPS O-acetylase OafA/YrhL